MTRALLVLQTKYDTQNYTVTKKKDRMQTETMIMKDFGQLSKKKKK